MCVKSFFKFFLVAIDQYFDISFRGFISVKKEKKKKDERQWVSLWWLMLISGIENRFILTAIDLIKCNIPVTTTPCRVQTARKNISFYHHYIYIFFFFFIFLWPKITISVPFFKYSKLFISMQFHSSSQAIVHPPTHHSPYSILPQGFSHQQDMSEASTPTPSVLYIIKMPMND